MTRAFDALERSLRSGAPDESGYIARPIDVSARDPEKHDPSIMTVERVRHAQLGRRDRPATPSFSVLSALALVLAIAVGGFVILGSLNRSGLG